MSYCVNCYYCSGMNSTMIDYCYLNFGNCLNLPHLHWMNFRLSLNYLGNCLSLIANCCCYLMTENCLSYCLIVNCYYCLSYGNYLSYFGYY